MSGRAGVIEMVFTFSAVVDAPLDEVFAWHARPGAITRLTPPWQPVGVVAESASLRDGRAVLAVPPRLRWVAAHEPDGYDPPHRFVDRLAGSPPLSWVLSWTHTHEFRAEDAATTRVTDTVDTPVPAALLRPLFAYRHAQLAADLDVHARARVAGGAAHGGDHRRERPGRHRGRRAAVDRRAPGGAPGAAGPAHG
jgi:hypothetical protein